MYQAWSPSWSPFSSRPRAVPPMRRTGAESGASRRSGPIFSRLGLSDDYTAYYNLPLNGNGRASDIDCILVGPSGLFVFEVKHHHGLILYRNGVWARIKVGRRGTLYRGQLGDPSGQLYRNIRKLKELLGKDQIKASGSRRRRLHEPAGRPRRRGTPMGQGHQP